MYGHWLENSAMLNSTSRLLLFWITELALLIAFGALAVLVAVGVDSTDPDIGAHLLSADEIRRAAGAAVLFVILSGYGVSIGVLCVLFRDRLLARSHTAFAVLSFFVHACFFLFVLRGHAPMSSGLRLAAFGTIAVLCARAAQYAIWRK